MAFLLLGRLLTFSQLIRDSRKILFNYITLTQAKLEILTYHCSLSINERL